MLFLLAVPIPCQLYTTADLLELCMIGTFKNCFLSYLPLIWSYMDTVVDQIGHILLKYVRFWIYLIDQIPVTNGSDYEYLK